MSRIEKIAEALEDADGWIRTLEGWEAAALLRQMEEILRLYLRAGVGNSTDFQIQMEADTKTRQLLENTYGQPQAQV